MLQYPALPVVRFFWFMGYDDSQNILRHLMISINQLKKLMVRFGSISCNADGEWLGDEPWVPLNFIKGSTGDAWFISKSIQLDAIRSFANRLPARFVLAGPIDQINTHSIADYVSVLKCQLHYLGDLDPIGLLSYLCLSVQLNELGRSVQYLGINDSWLEICQKHLDCPFGRITRLMNESDQRRWKLLTALPIEWPQIIGKKSWNLLQSGRVLELEGVLNPTIYGREYFDQLGKVLMLAYK
jgi:hypothetical protein